MLVSFILLPTLVHHEENILSTHKPDNLDNSDRSSKLKGRSKLKKVQKIKQNTVRKAKKVFCIA